MRKHFLLLFLMALLPLAGWAADVAPTTAGDLDYNSQQQALFASAGTFDDGTAYYAVTTVNSTVGAEWVTWTASGPTAKNVGTYYLWYKVVGGTSAIGETPLGTVNINAVDISDGWSIVFEPATATYTGDNVTPVVKLKNGGKYLTDGFQATWDPVAPFTEVNANGYTVTVTKNMTETYGDLAIPTKKFWVLMANAAQTTPGTVAADITYAALQTAGGTLTLVQNAPVVTFGQQEIEYSLTPAVEASWSKTIPTATKVGVYNVYYRVPATTNYNGIASTLIGTVEISGTALVEDTHYAAPTQVSGGLTFTWENGAAKLQDLLTAGTIENIPETSTPYGVMKYKKNADDEWSTTIPQGDAATNYRVYWMIEAAEGYYNVGEDNSKFLDVTIAPKQPTVYSAQGSTLTYRYDAENAYVGVEQALIDTENPGSATDGATVSYKFRYKAPGAAGYTTEWAACDVKALAEVVGINAGTYQIKTLVVEEGNYLAAEADEPIEVVIAPANAFTDAPTAADLTWNGATAQQLINEGTGTVPGKVQYFVAATANQPVINWTTNIATILGTKSGLYTVSYKVVGDPNFVEIPASEATIIPNVKIKKKALSVKVNDVTKTYDGTTDLTDELYATAAEYNTAKGTALTDLEFEALTDAEKFKAPDNYTIDDDLAKFTFITPITGFADFSKLNYAVVAAANKNVGEHTGVVSVNKAALEAIYADYDYTIIPGKLTVNKAKLTVTANTGLKTQYGVAADISAEYVVTGLATGEAEADAFGIHLPVLTSNAGTNPAVGHYTLSWNKGTLEEDANYEMSTEGDGGYVIPAGADFEVYADPDSKIVITVLPKTQVYSGQFEDWSGMVAGTDYYVTGLIDNDKLATAPTFSREKGEGADGATYNVGVYALNATGATISDEIKSKYPGGIVYNQSTFTITAAPVRVSISEQNVRKDVVGDFDENAWDVVEGLKGGDIATGKAVLEGTLTNEQGVAVTGDFNEGIKLVIANTNYKLVNATGEEIVAAYGILHVLPVDMLVLSRANTNLATQLEALNETEHVNVKFAETNMTGMEWHAMVLPFATTPLELVKELGTYVVVNKIASSSIDAAGTVKVNFSLVMSETIEAGVPFLIKPAADITWQKDPQNVDIIFDDKTIAGAPVDDPTAKATFKGTYNTGEIVWWQHNLDGTENPNAKRKWLAYTGAPRTKLDGANIVADGTYSDNHWKLAETRPHYLTPMEAYLELDEAANEARIFVEDFENGATVIKELGIDGSNKAYNVDGWYTIDGIKLQGAPTEKGVYINNGKKVVLK